jgi:tight adherence protein B
MLSGAMAFLGLLLGLVLPWIYLKKRHSRRLNAFNGQLAETLGLMAGGLQAGLSLPQAVDTVVREGIEPMAGELRRALVEQRLGVDITDGLEAVGERMESDDFGWVVMAIRIQREIGGNLAEILNTVAMPPFVMVYLSFANRQYIEVLWSTAIGWVILSIAGVMLVMGGMAMSKMAKVEV